MSGLGQLCVVLETACRARGKRGVLLLWELWVQKWPPRKLGLRGTLPQAFASSWPHASPAFTSGVAVFPPSEGNLIWPSADCCLGGDAVSLLTATTATVVITVAAIDYVLRNFHSTLTTIICSQFSSRHFTNGETEAQEGAFPGPHCGP